jgi:hypothetical protein
MSEIVCNITDTINAEIGRIWAIVADFGGERMSYLPI